MKLPVVDLLKHTDDLHSAELLICQCRKMVCVYIYIYIDFGSTKVIGEEGSVVFWLGKIL